MAPSHVTAANPTTVNNSPNALFPYIRDAMNDTPAGGHGEIHSTDPSGMNGARKKETAKAFINICLGQELTRNVTRQASMTHRHTSGKSRISLSRMPVTSVIKKPMPAIPSRIVPAIPRSPLFMRCITMVQNVHAKLVPCTTISYRYDL